MKVDHSFFSQSMPAGTAIGAEAPALLYLKAVGQMSGDENVSAFSSVQGVEDVSRDRPNLGFWVVTMKEGHEE